MSNTVNNYTETDLGNISLNPRGEYDSSVEYEYLDAVSYQGGSYFCLAELETTITGIAPDAGRNSEHWQMIAAPGDMTPEYTAAYNNVINKAVQVEESRAAVELAQQEIEAVQTDVQQLHSDTVQTAQEAENSKNSAADSAQSAEQSRKTASESERNINGQIAGFDSRVSEAVEQSKEEINTTKQQAINTITKQQTTSVNTVKTEGEKIITRVGNDAKTVADDRATVEEATQTVLNNAQEVARNAQIVAGNTENAAASAESAKTSADNAAQSAKGVEDASKQIEQNKKDVDSLKEDIGELPNNIVSSTDSFVQYNYVVKSGEKHRFGLFDYSGDYFKQCEIYLFKGDNSYKQIGILRNVGEFIDYVATDNYAFVRYVFQTTEPESETVTKRVYSHLSTLNNSLSDEVEENRQSIFKNAKAIAINSKSMDNIMSTVNDFKSFIGEKKEEVYTITSSPTWTKTEITLVKNTKYDFSIEKNDNIQNVILYDTGYNQKALIYNTTQGLTGISYTPTENFTVMLLVYLVDKSISTDVKLSIKSGLMGKDEISKDEINVLIIGDSYSALGNWVNELSKMVNINNLVNLGVSSATLKDKYKDTTLYPYTSRPIMSSSDGNLNVFHNQILKLKRLMDGTDLDSGESQIYTTPDEHPDVIFIEGGTNDNVDSDTNDYRNILYNQKKCYVKYGENDIRNSNAYIKKDMSDVDKTTFVGALSYLHSELHVMFPKAKIIMISPCGLSYPNGNNMNCITIDNQLTEASKYFAMSVVHWLNTGVSYYNIPTSGDGTENNPYSIADTTDTKDWLHPTSDSANKLAKEVYAELKKYFNV